jgi:NhaP-type Na+/H+ or K+/H+ antiporter
MYLFNGVIAELVNLFGYFNLKTNDAYYFFLIVFAILILVGVLLGYISDKIINKIYFSISNKFKRKT